MQEVETEDDAHRLYAKFVDFVSQTGRGAPATPQQVTRTVFGIALDLLSDTLGVPAEKQQLWKGVLAE